MTRENTLGNGNGFVKKDEHTEQQFYESGRIYSPEFIVRHTVVPERPENKPRLLGLVGPVRGGTTAFGFSMASHPRVERSYFQPWKALLRHGTKYGDFVLPETDGVVVAKDTFGPQYPEENFDPIGMSFQAGIPPQRTAWILTMRNPLFGYASLKKFIPRKILNVDYYQTTQEHTVNLARKYRGQGVNVTSFSYDLFGHEVGELEVLRRLLQRTDTGLEDGVTLEFDSEAIQKRMVWGEASDPTYFEEVIAPTLNRGRFTYTSNGIELSSQEIEEIQVKCMPTYTAFHQQAQAELGL